MLPNPLHPALVHFPIVLMTFLPVVVAGVLWRLHDGARGRTWAVVVAWAALTVGSGWVAMRAGHESEEVVEDVVPGDALDAHEEAGEQFVIGAWVVLGLAALGLLPGLVGRTGRLLTLAGALGLVYLGWRAGDLGGKLAYQHGAAAAYVVPAGDQGVPGARQGERERDDDDDRPRGREGGP